MTFQQLTYVVEVARCASINKAAERLYTHQSNVSSVLRQLEDESFWRTPRNWWRRKRFWRVYTLCGVRGSHSGFKYLPCGLSLPMRLCWS